MAEVRQDHAKHAPPIPEPEPAHIPDGIPAHEREATELLPPLTSTSAAQTPQDDEQQTEAPRRISRILTPSTISSISPFTPLKKFWRHNVQLTVPHVDCRDHLANERTFLGYLRTSVALSMMGVVVAQLWRLQHSPNPDPVFGFYVLSIPIAVILQSAALIVVVIGAIRYWRQQDAMAVYGKVVSGGWELGVVGVGSLLILLTVFALQVALDVRLSNREDI
ncbi:uncharacterized protein RHO25_006353 [Cercospora beticola]|uniref:DUF202 domain-containing protein n=1 Tax=Cercospora beticola TaxID=122368 RepID=A0ABZ0NQ80_CERBT|nr:hypothetical protein RHO25_006353 [Cercospora beticola]